MLTLETSYKTQWVTTNLYSFEQLFFTSDDIFFYFVSPGCSKIFRIQCLPQNTDPLNMDVCADNSIKPLSHQFRISGFFSCLWQHFTDLSQQSQRETGQITAEFKSQREAKYTIRSPHTVISRLNSYVRCCLLCPISKWLIYSPEINCRVSVCIHSQRTVHQHVQWQIIGVKNCCYLTCVIYEGNTPEMAAHSLGSCHVFVLRESQIGRWALFFVLLKLEHIIVVKNLGKSHENILKNA